MPTINLQTVLHISDNQYYTQTPKSKKQTFVSHGNLLPNFAINFFDVKQCR